MRVEIKHTRAVHTSQGKAHGAVRLDLPDDEALLLIANGLAMQVRERAPEPDGDADQVVLDVPEETDE